MDRSHLGAIPKTEKTSRRPKRLIISKQPNRNSLFLGQDSNETGLLRGTVKRLKPSRLHKDLMKIFFDSTLHYHSFCVLLIYRSGFNADHRHWAFHLPIHAQCLVNFQSWSVAACHTGPDHKVCHGNKINSCVLVSQKNHKKSDSNRWFIHLHGMLPIKSRPHLHLSAAVFELQKQSQQQPLSALILRKNRTCPSVSCKNGKKITVKNMQPQLNPSNETSCPCFSNFAKSLICSICAWKSLPLKQWKKGRLSKQIFAMEIN